MTQDEDKTQDNVEHRVDCPLFKCGWFFTSSDYNTAKQKEWEHWLEYHTENR